MLTGFRCCPVSIIIVIFWPVTGLGAQQGPGPDCISSYTAINCGHRTLRRDNEEVDPRKVLMGLNFYGNYYKKLGEGGPIVGHEYLDILDRERPPIAWDAAAAEHLATLRDKGDPNKGKRHVVVRAG